MDQIRHEYRKYQYGTVPIHKKLSVCAVPVLVYIGSWLSVLRIRIRIRIHKSELYGSGPGSFYHQAIIVRKTLIPRYCFVTSLWLFVFEKWCKCNVPSKSNKQINFGKKYFFDDVLKITDESSRIRIQIRILGSISQRYGSADPDPHPDPYQNFMDPHSATLLITNILRITNFNAHRPNKEIYLFETVLWS